MYSRRSFLNTLCVLVAAGVMIVAANSDAPAAAQGPDGFIRTTGQAALDSLTSKELTDDQRESRFRVILRRTFDVKVIARFALGRYWRRASKAQRTEYVELFEDFIVRAYAIRFKGYSGEGFEVGKMRPINDRERLVLSIMLLEDGRKIAVHWRVRGNKKYRIIDVVVEGVSMAITQRDEFSAIISRNGGKIDGLLAALRKKTGKQSE